MPHCCCFFYGLSPGTWAYWDLIVLTLWPCVMHLDVAGRFTWVWRDTGCFKTYGRRTVSITSASSGSFITTVFDAGAFTLMKTCCPLANAMSRDLSCDHHHCSCCCFFFLFVNFISCFHRCFSQIRCVTRHCVSHQQMTYIELVSMVFVL